MKDSQRYQRIQQARMKKEIGIPSTMMDSTKFSRIMIKPYCGKFRYDMLDGAGYLQLICEPNVLRPAA